jgi:hypothetical protein
MSHIGKGVALVAQTTAFVYCQTEVTCFNRRLDLRLESSRKSRWMNLSSVYLRRSGCLYVYTGPILPPAATSAPGTYPAEASLYIWSVPIQLERTYIRIYEPRAWHSHAARIGCTMPISSDMYIYARISQITEMTLSFYATPPTSPILPS